MRNFKNNQGIRKNKKVQPLGGIELKGDRKCG